jgi:hypothetical protein
VGTTEFEAVDSRLLRELLEKERIRDVLYRYIRGVDRFDKALIRSAFHPDATDQHGDRSFTISELIDWMGGRQSSVEQSMHLVGNILIELYGDNALVESHGFAHHRYAPGASESHAGEIADTDGLPTRVVTVYRYVDKFQRREGEWRIRHRTVVLEDTWPLVLRAPLPSASLWSLAKRDASDPLWVARAEFLEYS